jgi:hypothetical protein
MRRLPRALLLTASVILAAQVVRFAPTNPPVAGDLRAPAEIKGVLRRACYDCHSHETAWPWYSRVAPLSWLIHHDVLEGRRRLNFSEWTDYASDPGTVSEKLQQISQRVARGDMAPLYYRVLHPDGGLTAAQRDAVAGWAAHEAVNQGSSR